MTIEVVSVTFLQLINLPAPQLFPLTPVPFNHRLPCPPRRLHTPQQWGDAHHCPANQWECERVRGKGVVQVPQQFLPPCPARVQLAVEVHQVGVQRSASQAVQQPPQCHVDGAWGYEWCEQGGTIQICEWDCFQEFGEIVSLFIVIRIVAGSQYTTNASGGTQK